MEVSRQGAKYGLNQFNWGECVLETRDPCPGVVCSRMQGGCARLSYRGRLSHGNSSWLPCWSETLSGNSLNLDCCFGAFTGVQGFPTPKPACSVKQPWRKEEQRQDLLLVPGSSGQDGELPAWFSGNVGVLWVLHP